MSRKLLAGFLALVLAIPSVANAAISNVGVGKVGAGRVKLGVPNISRKGIGNGAVVTPPLAPLRIVGNLTRVMYNADQIANTSVQATETRAPHFLGGQPVTQIYLAYGNYYVPLASNGQEFNTGNAINEVVGLEYNGVTVMAPNANVASPHVAPDNEGLFLAGPFNPSDFGVSQFPAGAAFFSRTRAWANVLDKLPRTGQYLSQTPAYKQAMPLGTSQITGTGPITAGTIASGGYVAPLAILGRTVAPEIALITVGDSIGEGSNDAVDYPSSTTGYPSTPVGGGYEGRGLANVNGRAVPVARLGRHGGKVAGYVGYSTNRQLLYPYATHMYVDFGANDLFWSSSTGPSSIYTTFQTNMTSIVTTAKAAGLKYVVVGAVAPQTQSNDSFASSGGQQPQGVPSTAGYWDPIQVATTNTYLSQNVGDAFFNMNLDWGESGGAAKWVTNGTAWYPLPSPGDGVGNLGGAYVNGTHPGPALSILAGTRFANMVSAWTPTGGPGRPSTSRLLLEASAGFLLTESGDKILLENGQ